MYLKNIRNWTEIIGVTKTAYADVDILQNIKTKQVKHFKVEICF